jgi:hypothetical protein
LGKLRFFGLRWLIAHNSAGRTSLSFVYTTKKMQLDAIDHVVVSDFRSDRAEEGPLSRDAPLTRGLQTFVLGTVPFDELAKW